MKVLLSFTENFFRKETPMMLALKEKGQSLVENVILLFLVVLIVIAVLWLLGFRISVPY